MPLRIQPFEARHAPAVAAFNRRLAAAGSHWHFPESSEPSWLARVDGSPVFQEFFVAVDGNAVHGAYALQHRPAALAGVMQPTETWYLPISEGAVDPRHALLGMQLVRDAFRRAPLSFCLGMNGVSSPLAGLIARLGCEPRPVPFFVRIEHGARFAREARALRKRRGLAPLLDLAAVTGAASLGAGLLKLALRRGPGLEPGTAVETVAEFGPWADALWERVYARYSFVTLRDAATLNRLYPKERQRVTRIRLVRDGEPLGWAVLQAARMSDNPNFGNLHVGRITDVFAAPEAAGAVIRAAAERLAADGVDLIVSNQSHPEWCAALRQNAFLEAPSNFAFASSPDLMKRIRAFDPEQRRLHLNRGDGDGPWGHDPGSF